ncbi:MAG: hypothetical protein Q7U88_10345 [Desulfocapsaceae bacterium]|nr:hypothetical protein [Desulfocapsaceae bacterium]
MTRQYAATQQLATFCDAINFGHFHKIMVKRGLTPHDAGMALSRTSSSIEELTKNLSEFLEAISEFWNQVSDAAYAHVEDMHETMKGVFGGDLFPAHNNNIASKCGLYTDTLVLPDPFMRSKNLFEQWEPEQKAYYLIKHGLNLLQYKELACADLAPPIVVILPDRTALEEDERKFIHELGSRDALIHAGKIFGRKFHSSEELTEYSASLDSIDKVVSAVQDPSRILFDTEWEGSLKEKLQRATTDQHARLLHTNNPGIIVASQAVGRMSASNELLLKARGLRGIPIIDAPTSWQYLVWKLEYDAANAEREMNLHDLHVARGLQSLAENDMKWLGRVPPDALIEVRKSGAIKEIREILGKGVKQLTTASPDNFHRTSDQVFDNIHAAFEDHRIAINELTSKKWKFAGSDIGSWLVVGSLAVTAAATGLPVWGLAAIAADQLLDAPKLKDIPKSIADLAKESQRIRQSPVGMLFRYTKEKS